ncbi:unnamed protein product [Didymodactylos carnosus]|uniref:Uncharacterized protein n=1 Tax=Didymodactylos carnosus TaxID=1234261 RepID=A0A814EXL3_9BILA|nr:unnamed protein product [Didymodactylos carnosus]CAF3750200.1 unnamed protein product [Didymodactylos carnosus]
MQPWSIRSKLDKLQLMLDNLRMANTTSRRPCRIAIYNSYKTSEFKAIVHFGFSAFQTILKSKYYNNFLKFVYAMNIGNGDKTIKDDASTVELLMNEFGFEFENLYTTRHCSSNIHSMQHAHLSIQYIGPFFTYSTFFFESINRILKSLAHGTIEHSKQLIKNLELFRTSIIHYDSPIYPRLLSNLCEQLLNEKKATMNNTVNLPKPSQFTYHSYTDFLSGIFGLGNITFYDTIYYNNTRYEINIQHSRKTDDSCIMFNQLNSAEMHLGFVSAIITLDNNNENIYFLMNKIVIKRMFKIKLLNQTEIFLSNSWICLVEKDSLVLIRPVDVQQKLVYRFLTEKQLHVFKYPNLKESR